MATPKRKEELRALMKLQKQQKNQSQKQISSKYSGKSKKELLAILKAKQAEANKKKKTRQNPSITTAAPQALPPTPLPEDFFDSKVPPSSAKPPDSTPPKPVSVLPGFGDEDATDSDEEAPSNAPELPYEAPQQPAPGLPEGFFDNPAMPTAEPAKEEADDIVPANSTAALPENFFDDPVADAKAKGIDLKAKKKAEEEKEWEEFKKFADDVKTLEQEEEKMDEQIAEQDEKKGELEQMEYFTRYAQLLQKADHLKDVKEKKLPRSQCGSSDDKIEGVFSRDNIPHEEENDDNDSDEINKLISVNAMNTLLMKRKRQKTSVIQEETYTPLDPLDWRSKMI